MTLNPSNYYAGTLSLALESTQDGAAGSDECFWYSKARRRRRRRRTRDLLALIERFVRAAAEHISRNKMSINC